MPAFKVSEPHPGAEAGGHGAGDAGARAGRRGKDAFPALVVQRAGEGRAAALTVGDLWRWGLRRVARASPTI